MSGRSGKTHDKKAEKQVQLLSELASLLLLSENPHEILDDVSRMLSENLDLETYFNYLVTESGKQLRLYSYAGITEEVAGDVQSLDFGQALCGCVARDKKRIIAEDIHLSSDPRTDLFRTLGIKAYCCHPLIGHGKLIGTLAFCSRKRTRFDASEIELMNTVCDLIATTMERASLVATLTRVCKDQEELILERTSELQISNEALKREVEERRRVEKDLKESRQQAELYLDLMGHDINNMHQIALGYLGLASEAQLETEQSDLLDKPIEALQRSALLIQNVRKLQKLREGAFQIYEVDVREVLLNVFMEFGKVSRKDIKMNLNGCRHCHVRANDLLRDVFTNLVSNAIKYTGDQGEIIISLTEGKCERGSYCQASFEDNGPGIQDSFKEIVFNRMLKGTNNAKGSGLGLYFVKSLVDCYGGRVWVEDRVPGNHSMGAKFVVRLPLINQH